MPALHDKQWSCHRGGWASYDMLTEALVEGTRIVGEDFRDGTLTRSQRFLPPGGCAGPGPGMRLATPSRIRSSRNGSINMRKRILQHRLRKEFPDRALRLLSRVGRCGEIVPAAFSPWHKMPVCKDVVELPLSDRGGKKTVRSWAFRQPRRTVLASVLSQTHQQLRKGYRQTSGVKFVRNVDPPNSEQSSSFMPLTAWLKTSRDELSSPLALLPSLLPSLSP